MNATANSVHQMPIDLAAESVMLEELKRVQSCVSPKRATPMPASGECSHQRRACQGRPDVVFCRAPILLIFFGRHTSTPPGG